jgi:hypothetical protein
MKDQKDQPPHWYLLTDLIIKCLAILGSVYLFIAVTKPTADVDLRLKQHETTKSQATSITAIVEANKSIEPLLSIKPIIEQTSSDKDVRGLHIETQLSNVGLIDIVLKRIEIEAYEGKVSTEVYDVINRTQKIHEYVETRGIQRIVPPSDNQTKTISQRWADSLKFMKQDYMSGFDKTKEEKQGLEDGIKLIEKPPPGQLFLISEKSKDITWSHLDRVKDIRPLQFILRPNQSASEHFHYILTENLEPHYGWLRFVIKVNPGEITSQRFEFIIPTGDTPRNSFWNAHPVSYLPPASRPGIDEISNPESPVGFLIPRGQEPSPKNE